VARVSTAVPAVRALQVPAIHSAVWAPSDWAAGLFLVWFGALQIISGLVSPQYRAESRGWFAVDVGLLIGLAILAALHARLAPAWRSHHSPLGHWAGVLRYSFAVFVVLPLAYSEAGTFGLTLVPSVEHWFISADKALFGIDWYARRPPAPGFASTIFESAYLSNYALLFLAFLLAMFLRSSASAPSQRRTLISRLLRPGDPLMLQSVCGSLVAGLLLCYAFFPLLPAITPRLYFPALRHPIDGAVHDVNWALLASYSIPYGIFPSGHVAGPVAIGCALAARRRKLWAAFFLISALLIAIATVYGNYHFVCDAVGGWFTGMAAWALIERAITRRSAKTQKPPLLTAEPAEELRAA
jgi:membrane-associated phospholipid phosphatase